jgi:hypothetical protein
VRSAGSLGAAKGAKLFIRADRARGTQVSVISKGGLEGRKISVHLFFRYLTRVVVPGGVNRNFLSPCLLAGSHSRACLSQISAHLAAVPPAASGAGAPVGSDGIFVRHRALLDLAGRAVQWAPPPKAAPRIGVGWIVTPNKRKSLADARLAQPSQERVTITCLEHPRLLASDDAALPGQSRHFAFCSWQRHFTFPFFFRRPSAHAKKFVGGFGTGGEGTNQRPRPPEPLPPALPALGTPLKLGALGGSTSNSSPAAQEQQRRSMPPAPVPVRQLVMVGGADSEPGAGVSVCSNCAAWHFFLPAVFQYPR